MIYDKYTGKQTGGANLLTIIQGIVTSYGFTVEFYGDNVISSVNLGKKLILKKDNIYYYLAASDNNNPTANTTSFINNKISCLKMAQGLTLNTSNNWYLNNLAAKTVGNIPGCEYKPNTTYTIYINNDNMILINTFQVGLYSAMIIGNMKKLGHNDNVSVCFGSNQSNSGLVSNTRIAQIPFLNLSTTLGSVIKGSTAYLPSQISQNNFQYYDSGGGITTNHLSYFTYRSTSSTLQYADMNRGFSTDLDITYTFDFVAYYRKDNNYFKRLFTYDELRIVNMQLLNAGDQLPDGDNIYEVWPFIRKEVPQNYGNNDSWGFGYAIQVAGA